jgi:hypothetical protein
LPAILHVADQTALRAGIGNPFPRAPLPIATEALARLGMTEADLDPLSESLSRELAKAAELLNLDVAAGR